MIPVRFGRSDKTRKAIVEALERCGWKVWDIRWPADLLCYKAAKGFRVLECKSAANKKNEPKLDKRQKDQAAFVRETNTPYVVTPEQAIQAVES